MYKILVALFIVVILVISFLLYMREDSMQATPMVTPESESVMHIGTVPMRVEVANTDALRRQGLSGRDSLDAASGMLFIFNESDYHQIWMKDMHMPIDVIWIDENFTVIDITRKLHPDTFPQTFGSVSPARFVIETNSDYTESAGIAVGDVVTFQSELIPEDLRK